MNKRGKAFQSTFWCVFLRLHNFSRCWQKRVVCLKTTTNMSTNMHYNLFFFPSFDFYSSGHSLALSLFLSLSFLLCQPFIHSVDTTHTSIYSSTNACNFGLQPEYSERFCKFVRVQSFFLFLSYVLSSWCSSSDCIYMGMSLSVC